MSMSGLRATCDTCGVTKRVASVRESYTCNDCKRLATIPDPTDDDGLPMGQWVRQGAVLVFVPEADPVGFLMYRILSELERHTRTAPRLSCVLCDVCGCALRDQYEICPGCAVQKNLGKGLDRDYEQGLGYAM